MKSALSVELPNTFPLTLLAEQGRYSPSLNPLNAHFRISYNPTEKGIEIATSGLVLPNEWRIILYPTARDTYTIQSRLDASHFIPDSEVHITEDRIVLNACTTQSYTGSEQFRIEIELNDTGFGDITCTWTAIRKHIPRRSEGEPYILVKWRALHSQIQRICRLFEYPAPIQILRNEQRSIKKTFRQIRSTGLSFPECDLQVLEQETFVNALETWQTYMLLTYPRAAEQIKHPDQIQAEIIDEKVEISVVVREEEINAAKMEFNSSASGSMSPGIRRFMKMLLIKKACTQKNIGVEDVLDRENLEYNITQLAHALLQYSNYVYPLTDMCEEHVKAASQLVDVDDGENVYLQLANDGDVIIKLDDINC